MRLELEHELDLVLDAIRMSRKPIIYAGGGIIAANAAPCLRAFAERTGIPRRMLRYYEETGMLIPGRCANGYRNYDEDSVDRALQIRGLLDTGMSTRVIKQVLPCLKQPGIIHVFDATPETLAILERERKRKAAVSGPATKAWRS